MNLWLGAQESQRNKNVNEADYFKYALLVVLWQVTFKPESAKKKLTQF